MERCRWALIRSRWAPRRVQRRGGARRPHARRTPCTLSVRPRAPTKPMGPHPLPLGAEKGPAARRHPTAAREAYSLYVERAAEGANEADGPLSAPGLSLLVPEGQVPEVGVPAALGGPELVADGGHSRPPRHRDRHHVLDHEVVHLVES